MSVLSPVLNLRSILTFFSIIYRQRELTLEMTRREFSERYAGQILGIFWAFVHPIAIIFVYLFIFSFVFQVRLDPNEATAGAATGNYAVYLLAGLLPWMAMAESLNKGTQIITSNANLVKQVIFPLEVLPAKSVLATCFNEVLLLTGVLIYAAFQSPGPVWSWSLLPIVLGLQFIQMLGISLMFATIGVYVRDLKDVVQVFCFINIYLMPVVYMPNWLPESVRWAMYLNPFTYQTLCFQDVIHHGEITSYWVWAVFVALSLLSLGVGYRLFTKLRVSIGNVL